MNDELPHSWTGGARVGLWNYTIPCARLSVQRNRLFLHIDTEKIFGIKLLRFLGVGPRDFSFGPAEVSGIEAVGRIPVLSTGVRIHHTIPEYPRKVIFWCGGLRNDAEKIVDLVIAQGFNPYSV